MQGAVLGAGEDGRYVYFAAKGALAEGARRAERARTPAKGRCVNLYAYDTQERAAAARGGALREKTARTGALLRTGHNLGQLTSRVSPNGRYVAFMSERPLSRL